MRNNNSNRFHIRSARVLHRLWAGYLVALPDPCMTLMACLLFLGACETPPGSWNSGKPEPGRDMAQDVVIDYSIRGKKKALLRGPVMYRVQDTVTYAEFPQTVHVDFYDIRDSIESYLDARYGRYTEGQSRVFLKDSVRIINRLGDTLYCEELYWDRARTNQEFYTEKPVRIRRRAEIIDGVGMAARQDFKEWVILKPVGYVKVPRSSFPD
jgi:LPS export ABC transporter protein LptC